MQLNIDSSASVTFTNNLEKLHRSALPNAIRGALNKAAFDVKQNTMPRTAGDEFVKRQPNFFKANSRVEMAKGWAVEKMEATVGFIEGGLQGSNNYAVKDLEQQERGGTIKGRSFIPTSVARGGSDSRPVRPGNRMNQVKRIINSNKGTGTRKGNFITAARMAGAGGFVLGNNAKKILWRIESITQGRRGKIKIRKKALYSFEDNRTVRVKATDFMRSASLITADKLQDYYMMEAKRQVEKLMT